MPPDESEKDCGSSAVSASTIDDMLDADRDMEDSSSTAI
jgi:hypothetical protein